MIQTTQGAQVTLNGTFRLTSGQLVDPTDPHIDIFDPAGNYLVQNDIPTRESVGEYYYVYTVPPTAVTGIWSARWTGLINGLAVTSAEAFEVLPAGSLNTTAQAIERIRMFTGERIPEGGTDRDTRFSDSDMSDIYRDSGGSLNLSVLQVWLAKAAYFAQYIDMEESGSNRKFSQLYKNANDQVAMWQRKVNSDNDAKGEAVAATRVVGATVRWAVPADEGILGDRVMHGPDSVRMRQRTV